MDTDTWIPIMRAGTHTDSELHLLTHTADADGDIILLNSIDLNGKAPGEIQLIPYGIHDTLRYGKVTIDDESLNSIMAFRKTREPNDEVIDYEHATFTDPPIAAPAAGWIKKLINKGKDGIWAMVEWTDKARKMIEAKEYRYFSPVTLSRKDGKVLGLLGGGLTNLPNIIGMVPLTNRLSSPLPSPLVGEGGVRGKFQTHKEDINMKRIAALLGLPETATEDEIVAAMQKLMSGAQTNKGVIEALGLKEGATSSELIGTILAMKASHTQSGDLTKTVADLQSRLQARELVDLETLVNSAIAGDAKGAKLLPAQKEWALAYAKRDPEGFKVFLNTAQYAVLTGKIVPDDKGGGSGELDETTLKVCRLFGNDPAEVKKNMPQAA